VSYIHVQTRQKQTTFKLIKQVTRKKIQLFFRHKHVTCVAMVPVAAFGSVSSMSVYPLQVVPIWRAFDRASLSFAANFSGWSQFRWAPLLVTRVMLPKPRWFKPGTSGGRLHHPIIWLYKPTTVWYWLPFCHLMIASYEGSMHTRWTCTGVQIFDLLALISGVIGFYGYMAINDGI